MSINWYPGHMAKTRRLMTDDLKNVDLVCELLDARIPKSSRNPELERMCAHKRMLLVLNRADQADPALTARWVTYYRERDFFVLQTDSQKGGFLPIFTDAARNCCDDLLRRAADKGQRKNIRIMVAGIPNVGKSSFINRLLGRKSAVAADRPGVTRGKQWYSLPGGFELMDTPGLLWPKIESDEQGFKLAFTGTIRDEILDLEDLACRLLTTLQTVAPEAVVKRYGVTEVNMDEPFTTLQEMARKRSYLLSGGECDTGRIARVLLDEFRAGKLGNITLETPSGI